MCEEPYAGFGGGMVVSGATDISGDLAAVFVVRVVVDFSNSPVVQANVSWLFVRRAWPTKETVEIVLLLPPVVVLVFSEVRQESSQEEEVRPRSKCPPIRYFHLPYEEWVTEKERCRIFSNP